MTQIRNADGISHRRYFWPARSRPILTGVVITLIALLILRIAATPALQWYVNNKLDESPKYAGQVGNIDLSLLRGAYSMEDVEITKTEGEVPVPLFAATRIEFSTLWRAIANGTPVAQVELFDPQINIVDSNDEAKKQTGAGGQWLQMIEDLFPLRLDRAIVHQGQLHFRNYDSDPRIDISLSAMDAVAENLSNQQALTESRIARLSMTALAMDVSDLTLAVAYDPATDKPSFDVALQMVALPILRLDNFVSSYAPFDVEAGSLDLSSELAAREGVLEGYIKPTIHNLEVFKWSEDIGEDGDGPVHALWEGLIAFIAGIKEQPHEQLISHIPVHGNIDDPDANVFVAIAGVVKNSFVEAYQVNLENTVSLLVAEEPDTVAMPPPLETQAL